MKTAQLRFGDRGIRHDRQYGQVVTSRYEGRFTIDPLQFWSDNGMWVVRIMGNPHVPPHRSGPTPRLALLDARRATEDLIAKLQQGLQAIDNALSEEAELERRAESV